ncbi:MAG: hypothetical protein WBN75_07540 [Verrucomicrobiia bacterium]|jgi:hypothetical protein
MKKNTVIIIAAAVVIVVLGITVVRQHHQLALSREAPRRAAGADPFQMKKLPADENARYAAMPADEAARGFFEACGRGDWAEVEKFWPGVVPLEDRMKEALDGMEVVSLGKPFTRPGYADMFVPYEIRFKNGEIKKYNLAVRRDNPAGRWMVDGGL